LISCGCAYAVVCVRLAKQSMCLGVGACARRRWRGAERRRPTGTSRASPKQTRRGSKLGSTVAKVWLAGWVLVAWLGSDLSRARAGAGVPDLDGGEVKKEHVCD
jgi:hypothetical protein